MISRMATACCLVGLLFASVGCGIFKSSTSQGSSESISDSVSSPFKWSSKSSKSSSGDDGDASSIDVRDATELWARDADDVDAFRRDVARIAESHGVTDWESDPRTYDAMGRGLQRAGIGSAGFEQLSTGLAGGDDRALASIRRGYDAEALN